MSSTLDDIIAKTRLRLKATPWDLKALEAQALNQRPPHNALAALSPTRGNAIISEVKRRSPSLGAISEGADAVETARIYAEGGAAAISVLTEPERFGGSFADLAAVNAAVSVPTLCKDFIVDESQVLAARAHGASLVLLILAGLTDADFVRLKACIEDLGMSALCEVHNEAELERALALNARIIGVNNRDLHTLKIDLATCERLRPLIPDDRAPIAESGISTADDIRRLRNSGFERFLIGSSLMQAPSPLQLLQQLVTAGTPLERDA